jgi:hypothetical protein
MGCLRVARRRLRGGSDYHKLAPYYPAQSVRESWRATVHFKLHLDQVVKPTDASEAEALRKLSERLERRVPYSLLPQWECYESPIIRPRVAHLGGLHLFGLALHAPLLGTRFRNRRCEASRRATPVTPGSVPNSPLIS